MRFSPDSVLYRTFHLLVLVILVLAPSFLHAQTLVPGVMPLEATVTPDVTVPGGKIVISGTATPIRNDNSVSVTIFPPDSEQVLLTTTLNSERRFELSYTVPVTELGRYAAVIRGPGGQGEASVEFEVVSFAVQSERIVERLHSVLDTANTTVQSVATMVASSPVSPAQAEMRERMIQLQEIVIRARGDAEKLNDALQVVDELVEEVPPIVQYLAPVYIQLDSGISAAEQAAGAAQTTANDHSLCDALYYTGQGLKTASLIYSLTAGAFEAAIGLLQGVAADTVTSTLPVQYRSSVSRAAITQYVNRGSELLQEPTLSMNNAVSALVDLVPSFVDGFFDVYCEKFTGPVKGELKVEIRENGRPWWKYAVEIDAVVNVRYQRGSNAVSIPVTGEFEGVGSKFTTWVDFAVLDPRVRKDVLVRFIVPPKSGSLNTVSTIGLGGVIAPAYFRVPLRGEVTGSKLKLELQPATQDFRDSSKAKAVYVLVNPTMPVPHVMTSDLPFQGAHFILTRSLGEKPELDIKIDRAARVSRVTKTATRNADMQGGNVRLKINASVTACNPECP